MHVEPMPLLRYAVVAIGAGVHVLLVIQLTRAEGEWTDAILEFLATIPGMLAVLIGFRLLSAPEGTFLGSVKAHFSRLGMGGSVLAIGFLSANFAIVHLISQRDDALPTLIIGCLAILTGFSVIGFFWWRESLRRGL